MRHPSHHVSGQLWRRTWSPLQEPLQFARPGVLSPGLLRLSAIVLSAFGMALMLISLRPFAGASLVSETGDDGGNLINQVGFLAAGLVFAVAMMCLARRRVLASLLSPGFLLLGAVLAYAVATAPDPDSTLRAVVLTLIGMFVAFATLVLPRSEKDFQIALMIAAAAALALSYGGLVLLPDLAKHGYDAYEPQHSGLWRGHFSHKNIAGPVMCVIAIFGLYLMRTGHRFGGLIIFAAGALFVFETGSKTTSGFFPLSILIVFMAGLFGRSGAAILAYVLAMALVAGVTIGSLYSPDISLLIGDFLGDETYTGRTALWEFSLSKIPDKPWLGYGLYNFWGTTNVTGLDKPFEAAWDYRFIVHGHNNFLDLLLNLGFVGGSVVFWMLYVGPVFDYARARRISGNSKLADMFFMIIVFVGLLSFLETFFLARNDPLWLMHAFGLIGLHVLARFSVSGIPASTYRR
ncbi:O-antigen ligase [Hoeflea sp. YIM 152468]|uniref:O-antigen ligase family protein n=1 Tax=Hoeflea sp. YIM 152468 TaxID=3031759 RepID=UPI0023DBDE2E|nr:O-antigen ligase [Hoeflea sp. YIM 152468]MDF1607151.1 O-antigen ligase [Hoeflea sp. YIM 152468]